MTWDELAKPAVLGPDGLERRVNAVLLELFGEKITEAIQAALDPQVIEYAGKKIALKLVAPGIDVWMTFANQFTATGRNEIKSYANRANELREWRKIALVELKEMWPDVEPLLPAARVPIGSPIPVVELLGSDGFVTPDPDLFEPPFAPPAGGGT